ncbi:Uncharacterized conserved protein [Plasmopara halstedii]|uniref:Uncharacterized conserved protein n=1 Tax=Plasmopara halstedii TaxID=4781 RepID=A0A0P1A5Q4_PLAHL|nr:Uncharacterized conserved protein [Plasmopara halstedii]CEG35541.1 Uncharacterized conserved protein [Plasmopara halstedii]|eukprot:XP_024571910.1 Uncharacterized conserved protein [Plasmopara halstedii]
MLSLGVAVLVLKSSPDYTRQLRHIALSSLIVLNESGGITSKKDVAELVMKWSDILRRGGLGAAQDELVERLVSCILNLSNHKQKQETLLFFIDKGLLQLLVQYVAWSKPKDPARLQRLIQSLTILVNAAALEERVNFRLSLVTLGQALGHLMRQDVVEYKTLVQVVDALMNVQQLASERMEEEADATRAIVVHRSDLADPDTSRVASCCSALVEMCSPQMPTSIKNAGLWALAELIQAVAQEKPSALHAQQLKAALGPEFATMMLSFPRNHKDLTLQIRASTVLDSLLHVARQNSAFVTRETYQLWMDQVRFWTGTEETKRKQQSVKGSPQQNFVHVDHNKKNDVQKLRQKLYVQLQLTSSRCLRTLTSSPQTRRYVCESPRTRAALFNLSRQIHEKRRNCFDQVNQDTAKNFMNIQRNLSWAFCNICTGFQNGAIALDCLYNASWTASLLQSRRLLPMSRFFRRINDLTDLPIAGAEEYEADTEFGWVDILTAWTASTDHQVRKNAIATLVFLAEQDQYFTLDCSLAEMEAICSKQGQILQAWLTYMLQRIRLLTGGELLAVNQMEEIANVSYELTPGNEQILFNPAVVDAGTSALAVLAELHHVELVHQGVVPLIALLSTTSEATPAQHSQCARVLANLVASYCLDIESGSPTLASDPTRVVVTSDYADIAKLLKQTASGKRFLDKVNCWRECNDPMQRSNYFRVVQNLRAYDEVMATGHLLQDVYCEGVHPIVPNRNSKSIYQTADVDESASLVDVVFVHGLRGHPFRTWRIGMEGRNEMWPDTLLARDLERNNVSARLVTLGYEAGMVSWSSPWPSLTLKERARVMLSALYAANIGRDRRNPGASARPVVFITHSMGGLLTKTMLLLEREHREQGVSSLAYNTKGVVFLAVPHFGSDLAKGTQSEAIRKVIRMHPAIEDLGADPNGRLKDLNDGFKQLGIDCFSIGEERAAPVALGYSAVIVKPDSANPGIGRFYVLPDSDHMTICKAKSRDDPLYQDILSRDLKAVVTCDTMRCQIG